MGIVSLSKESLDYLLNDTRFVCFSIVSCIVER